MFTSSCRHGFCRKSQIKRARIFRNVFIIILLLLFLIKFNEIFLREDKKFNNMDSISLPDYNDIEGNPTDIVNVNFKSHADVKPTFSGGQLKTTAYPPTKTAIKAVQLPSSNVTEKNVLGYLWKLMGNKIGRYQNRCIEHLECFYTGPPFYHPTYRPVSVLPSKKLSPQLHLYTRMNHKVPKIYKLIFKKLLRTFVLDPSLDTKFLIHGYAINHETNDMFLRLKNELLQKKPMNVIMVNWTFDSWFSYHQAVANGRAIAAYVARLINYQIKHKNLNPKSVHLIGFSLGAHISGWIGERVPGLARITALDPAGPWFQKAPFEVRLDSKDATFVDVMHTNGGNDFMKGLGLSEPIGDMDFYVNGGNYQPGCFYLPLGRKKRLFNTNTSLANVCSHKKSITYFTDSIKRCQFVGVECESYDNFKQGKCTTKNSAVALMGYHSTYVHRLKKNTSFYLDTSQDC